MNQAHLFRLGMDLETGATHEEETTGTRAPRDCATPKIVLAAPGGEPLAREQWDGPATALLDPERHDHFIRRGGKVYAGTHLIIEVIDGRGLDDEARIQQAFRDCIKASGATLLHLHTHKFSPQGVSGVAVLSESHISVHTWPEIGYGAFDVFMCGDADPWASVPVLKRAFQAREVRVQEFLRGEGLVG